MSAITVGGDLVHYEVLGRGRPVILVHGWLGSWRYWIPTMQQLHMKYRVYALDLFGFGDSSKNPMRYSIQQQVDMLEEFLIQLAIPKAAIIGHGLGSMIAAEFAFQHQERRVPRLMLVSTPLFDIGGLEDRQPARISRPAAPVDSDDPDHTIPSGSLQATIPSAGMMRAALLERMAAHDRDTNKIPNPIQSGSRHSEVSNNMLAESIGTDSLTAMLERCFRRTEIEFTKLQGDVSNTDKQVLEASVRDFDAAKMLDTVQQLRMPVVLIHGVADPIITAPTHEVWDYLIRDSDDNTVAIPLPKVRHFPMLEHDRFGRFVNDFLESPDVSNLQVKERWRRRSR